MTRFAEERKHGATMEEAIDPWPAELDIMHTSYLQPVLGMFSVVLARVVTMVSALLETHFACDDACCEEKVITQSGHVVMVSGLAPWINRRAWHCLAVPACFMLLEHSFSPPAKVLTIAYGAMLVLPGSLWTDVQ